MDDFEKQRLQELVDAIHLTAAALHERQAAAAAGSAWPGPGAPVAVASGAAPTADWRPLPMPRGWPPLRLGASMETPMFVPFVTAVPQAFPVYPTGNLPMGLSHAGLQPFYGNGWINPLQLQQMQPGYGYGYGYRPAPQMNYGYGLAHAGYGYEGAYPNPYGYAPVSQLPYYGMPQPHFAPQMHQPMQPNWSPIGMPQQQPQG
jgi:hypothetical protein